MGLMPLVAPYIAEQERKLKEALDFASKELLTDIPTIFVEGITDKQLLILAIKLFSPGLLEMLNNNQLRIFTEEGRGGCLQIYHWVHAWIHKGNKSKILALFDSDKAGKSARDQLVNSPVFKNANNCKASFLEPTEEIKTILKLQIQLYYELEHILSVSCWERIIKEGLAQKRSSIELNAMLGKHADMNKPTISIYRELISDEKIVNTILLYEPKKDTKDRIFHLVESSTEEDKKEYLAGFEKTIKQIEDRFLKPLQISNTKSH